MTQRNNYPLRKGFAFLTLAVAMQSAYANNVFIDNIWYRDYLDFAQNKGIFKPGATGLQIVQKDGSIFKLPDIPFPDFSAVSSKGATTSIGGAYTVTASHNEKFKYPNSNRPSHHAIDTQKWGNTTYRWENSRHNGDFAIQRLNKFVVESEGLDGVDIPQTDQGWRDLHERYGTYTNKEGKRKLLILRVGTGVASFTQDGKNNPLNFAYEQGAMTATMYELEKWGAAWAHTFPFKNYTTQGDSGSAFLIYDKVDKKWVILGTLHGIDHPHRSFYNRWDDKTVNAFKEQHTAKVALDKGEATFTSDTQLSHDGKTQDITKKDVSLTGGGTLLLSSNLNMGIGGLIFDKNQQYTVEGKEFTFKGAGVDIGEGTTVEWNVKGDPKDNLHKIGKGTLKVNVAQGNNLKVGNGTVDLNADKAFNNIYITSGKATIKLNSSQALSGGDFGGIFFANNGGTLDLNGHNFEVKKIAANDVGAVITNTADQKANVNIKATDKYIYHGTLKGNIDLNYKHETKPSDGVLVLDGGTDIKGDINIENGKFVMMGHATTHATLGPCTIEAWRCKVPPSQIIQNAERPMADKTGKDYMISNNVSDFNQPDWETRLYKFEKLNLTNADYHVGRNAVVEGDIVANGSTLAFGGDQDVYLDRKDGLNITGEGFGFDQKVVSGQSRADSTITYKGDIVADKKSTIDSWMAYFEASLDVKGGSTFNAHGDSVVKLRDQGIKVSEGSQVALNNVLVEGNKDKVTINASDDSTLTINNVIAKKAQVDLKGKFVQGALLADEGGVIHVDEWNLKNGNLETMDSGWINVGHLKTQGSQVASASFTINNRLDMTDLNPYIAGADASAWVGLAGNRITLNKDAKITASFSNDFLSMANVAFGEKYTLIDAKELKDDRADKDITFNLKGDGTVVQSSQEDNKIIFEFSEKVEQPVPPPVEPEPEPESEPQPPVTAPLPPTVPPVTTPGEPNPPVPPKPELPAPPAKPEAPKPNPQPRPEAEEIETAFYATAANPRSAAIYNAILEHNKNGGLAYQQVAIKDALTMGNVTDGANALAAIAARTNRMLGETARTITQTRMIQPVRTAIDSRLSSLRSPMVQTNASQYLVASVSGDLSAIGRAMDADALHQSVFVDVSGGYQKDASRKDRIVSTNFGYDKVFRVDGDVMVVGGAFSVTELNNQDGEAADDGRMYSLTGYVSLEGQEGFGFQSYLTAGHLANDRSFIPEVALGRQTFDEKSWMVMSSNYLKYRFNVGDIAVKPMLLADIGWTHTSGSESTHLKRDSLTDTTLDLGVGVEVEGAFDATSWMVQLTARHNVWRSADSVGVNLKNAQGFISYGLDNQKSTTFGAHGMISQRLSKTMMLDIATGATASTDGSLGINGNARLRWLF